MFYSNNRFNNVPNTRRGASHAGDYSFYEYPSYPQNNYATGPQHHQPQHHNHPASQLQQQLNYAGQQQQQVNYAAQQQQHKRERVNANKNQNNAQNNRDRPNPSPNHDDYKIYICPGCSLHFDCLSRNNRYTGRVPLILNCQHTVCQECIYKGAQNDNIICPTCKKTSQLNKKHYIDNIQEAFPPNYYLFGIIMWGKPQGSNFKSLAFVPAQVTLNHKKLTSEQEEETMTDIGEKCCFLSCNKVAVLRCQDCNDVYCTDCCTAVHKSAKSLWSHVQVHITNSNFSVELEKCPEHTNMDVEFFCKICETGACCYCFIDKHEGHERDHLAKLSDEELGDLHAYKNKAEQILKQLLISQKKLQNLCSGTAPIVDNRICSYFMDFYAKIYFIQKDLRKQLSNIQSVGIVGKGLGGISSRLESSIGILKNILMSAEHMNLKKINLRRLLHKLKDVQLTPCYLLTDGGSISDPIEFEVSPVLSNVDELFKLKKFEDCKYTLVSEGELPPDYTMTATDSLYESDAESCISSLLHSTKKDEANKENKKISSQSSLANSTKNQAPVRRAKFDGKQIIDNEKVEVTHIESLECFYVQLKKSQSRFIQMNKDIENYVKMGAMKVENPQINELYLALYVTKNEKIWCRGRLIEIKNKDADPLYEVFFIDYGSTQTLNIYKLREITSNLAQRKPFALQCELYNPTLANWGKNAHVYMGKMINGKELYMVVKNVNNGIYQVDLLVSSSDRSLTSIIDILIHTCSNALSTSSDGSSISSQRRESFVPEHKIFGNSMHFVKNQTEKVVLANVIDPHNIFVHIAAYVESLKKMNNELKQHYRNTTYESCIPIEGTFVVVEHKDRVRGNWHRALVKKVDMNCGRAQVLLVDWGNNIIVPWSSIRLLSALFTKMESQAILVKLAHVEPYQRGHAWSQQAINFLLRNFKTQDVLKMVVNNVEPLEVALFETSDCVDICINAQLVQENLADSTGKISQTLEWPQNNQTDQGFTEDEGFVAGLLKKVDESCEVDSDEEEYQDDTLVKQKVDVVKVVSPELIYIKFLHLENQELSLHKELQIYYHKERETKDSWKEKDDCVVLYSDYYVRGKVMEKVGDKYKINVYDKAAEIVYPKEKIFVYNNYFKKFPNMVYKSHLARIRPAGGDKWSLSSIEALERMFDKYKDIYATKVQGDSSNRSMPMLMWYTQIKIGGALEPSITKFVSLNNLLVKLGFAYKQQAKDEGNASKKKRKEAKRDALLETVEESKRDDVLEAVDKTKRDALLEEVDEAAPAASGVLQKAAEQLLKSLQVSSDGTDKDTSTESVEEVEKPNVSSDEAQEKFSLNSSDAAKTESSADWNELIEEELKESDSKQDSPYHTQEAEITDWKPAFPLEKREFNAWVTCAETEGILYLRDETLQPVYKDMEANLKQYFDDNKPTHKKKTQWQPGQICTISYKDYWYRGKVVKVNSPTEIVALMIDFGSDHVLSPKELYREILYPEIPAFASRIKLDRVFAKSGQWLSSDYDTLLEVVTEHARVVIKGSLDIEIPLAEVYTKSGLSVNQLLVDRCPNLTRSANMDSSINEDDVVVIEKEEELSLEQEDTTVVNTTTVDTTIVDTIEVDTNAVDTTSFVFKMEPLPEIAGDVKMPITIVGVLSYNKVVLRQSSEISQELVSLNDSIQKDYRKQPVVQDVKLGIPCICPYAEDGVWYRAKIHNIDGLDCGYVFVFFVDFGNVESVSTEEIRMMKPEWFDLTVPCYIATVNFELKTDNHLEHVFQHMKKLYGKRKFVEFVSEDPLAVNLYEDSGDLCYQSLVNNGLLRIK